MQLMLQKVSSMVDTIETLAEKYGESIDNLPIDILMEAIYNGTTTSILYDQQSQEEKKEKGQSPKI